jgi:hypothetical protein
VTRKSGNNNAIETAKQDQADDINMDGDSVTLGNTSNNDEIVNISTKDAMKQANERKYLN